jgi:D-amino-acid dehydrogenase
MSQDVIVLGAGMVGVSAASHLRRRGWDVTLVDRQEPGRGASFGNAGLIQREAVYPHPFPRALAELRRIATNRSIDAVYHPLALPGLASPLLRYWWHSDPRRYLQAVLGASRLIETCVDEHRAMAIDAGVEAMLRPQGWLRLFSDQAALDEALAEAETARREHGVTYAALDGDALAAAEPHLLVRRAGALHWTNATSVADPHGLTTAYARRFQSLGGTIAIGDAATLQRTGTGWQVQTDAGPVQAAAAVIALGADATQVTARFGYKPPLFGKRGYHIHYRLQGNAVLNHPILDGGSGFALTPMRTGIRMTTGAEFARTGASPTPVQLERAEPVARTILPLADRVDAEPWMGVRPCMPDMIPIVGAVPNQPGLWACFGHSHQGLTLGPTTGRLLAEMMSGETPFVDPQPYRANRFQ